MAIIIRYETPEYRTDECPYCGAPVEAGEPVGHWDGEGGVAGFTYSARCQQCRSWLVGTGQAGGEQPDRIVWTFAES